MKLELENAIDMKCEFIFIRWKNNRWITTFWMIYSRFHGKFPFSFFFVWYVHFYLTVLYLARCWNISTRNLSISIFLASANHPESLILQISSSLLQIQFVSQMRILCQRDGLSSIPAKYYPFHFSTWTAIFSMRQRKEKRRTAKKALVQDYGRIRIAFEIDGRMMNGIASERKLKYFLPYDMHESFNINAKWIVNVSLIVETFFGSFLSLNSISTKTTYKLGMKGNCTKWI